jgi:hypothetical protein
MPLSRRARCGDFPAFLRLRAVDSALGGAIYEAPVDGSDLGPRGRGGHGRDHTGHRDGGWAWFGDQRLPSRHRLADWMILIFTGSLVIYFVFVLTRQRQK